MLQLACGDKETKPKKCSLATAMASKSKHERQGFTPFPFHTETPTFGQTPKNEPKNMVAENPCRSDFSTFFSETLAGGHHVAEVHGMIPVSG